MASPGETTPPSLDRRREILLAALFLLALAVRLLYLRGEAQNNPLFGDVTMDAFYHHSLASQIASGHLNWDRAYFRAPLYYYALGWLYTVTGPSVLAGRIAGCVAGAVTCWLLARLGAALGGFRTGLIAGLAAALYWPLVYFDAELLTAVLENLLNVALLLLLLRAARTRSLPLFLGAGGLWGLSAITRPTVLALAPGFLTWLWLALPGRGKPALRRVPATALLLAGMLLVILPVTIRNYRVGGEFVLIATNGGVNFYVGNNPRSNGTSAVVPGTRPTWGGGFIDTHRIPAEELGRAVSPGEVSDYWYSKALAWIRSDPTAWAGLMFHKFRLFWHPRELPNNQPIHFFAALSGIPLLFRVGFPAIAILGLGGVVLLLPAWRTWFLPLAFALIYTGTIVAFFVNGRYRIPVVPVLILFAAGGIVRAMELVRARRIVALLPGLAGAGVGALLLLSFQPELRAFDDHDAARGHGMLADHYARIFRGGEPPAGVRAGRSPDSRAAIAHYRAGLRHEPENANLLCRLAWVLATAEEPDLRDPDEAISRARRAEALIRAGFPSQDTLSPLAAAFADLGDFEQAARLTRTAIDLARRRGDRDVLSIQERRLQAYEAGRPLRSPAD